MIMRLAAAKQIDQVARKRIENVALLAQSSLLGGMTGDQSDVACRTQPETLDRWPIRQGPERQTFGASIQQTVIKAVPPQRRAGKRKEDDFRSPRLLRSGYVGNDTSGMPLSEMLLAIRGTTIHSHQRGLRHSGR
jgi:hypothetical protein